MTEAAPRVGSGEPPRVPRTSGSAIAALVLGFFPTMGVGAVFAVVLGIRARHEIDASAHMITGRGMATAGIVLGGIGLAASALVWLLLIIAVTS